MSFISQPTNSQSLNGIISLSDGVCTIEDGKITGLQTLECDELDVSVLKVKKEVQTTFINVSDEAQIETLLSSSINNSGTMTTHTLNADVIPTINSTSITTETLSASSATIPTFNSTTITSTNGSFTGLNSSTLNVTTSATIPTITTTTLNATNITVPSMNLANSTITDLTNTNITSDVGNFNKIKVNTLEALNFQIDALSLEVLKLKKTLTNRTVAYTSVNQHTRSNYGYFNHFNLMPTGTIIHNYSPQFCEYPHWISCNGQELNVKKFKNLYSIIGNTYGYRKDALTGDEYFTIFNANGLFLRSCTGDNYYWDGTVSRNTLPTEGPQKDNMRSHTHQTTMLYNEAFVNNVLLGGTKSMLSNIQTNTSGSMNQTQTSTTYTDNKNKVGVATDETYPMYIGAFVFIKS